ncbi:MAG: amino acid ABC transporter substrate-binding protein, partial [Hyphomicrobiaceae bacterium]
KEAARCDDTTTAPTRLYSQRLRLKNPDDHIVLPEIISKEPLGPSVRQGDFQWFSLAKWIYYALLNAEELGVNQKNVDEMVKSTNPEVRRLLGTEGEFGKAIGLDNDWVVKIVKGVGNYAEIYDRNVGPDTPLKIARGVNNLWSKGGIQYAPPVR